MKNNNIFHWLTLMTCCILAAGSVGVQSNSYGAFYTSAAGELGVGQGIYAFHTTCSGLCTGLFCPVALKACQKYGMRRCICCSMIFVTVGTAAMGIGTNMVFFCIMSIIRGIANSFFAVGMVSVVVNNWFEKKHGFANGLTMSFSGLSGALFNPVFSSLINTIGWRNTYFVMAMITAVLILPATCFLRLAPEEMGLLPYGAVLSSDRMREGRQGADMTITKLTGEEKISVALLAIFAFSWSFLSGLTQYFIGYTQSEGLGSSIGAWMISAAMAGNIVFKLFMGILSDRVGAIGTCLFTGMITLFALLIFITANAGTPSIILLAAAFLYGTVYAVSVVGLSLLTRNIFSKGYYDRIFSCLNIGVYMGGAVTLVFIGLLYDVTGSYRFAMVLMAMIVVINLTIFVFLGKRKPMCNVKHIPAVWMNKDSKSAKGSK